MTSITVGPTATINQGGTVQESAIGTYNDGSTKILSSGVQWSSSASTTASVNSSGLVTGVAPGTATITAGFQATSGTSSITVNLGNVTALKILTQYRQHQCEWWDPNFHSSCHRDRREHAG